jgi:hypothetical protein
MITLDKTLGEKKKGEKCIQEMQHYPERVKEFLLSCSCEMANYQINHKTDWLHIFMFFLIKINTKAKLNQSVL